MSRFWHIAGTVVGAGLVLIPTVSGALPEGKAKSAVVTAGWILASLSNVFRALGLAQPPKA